VVACVAANRCIGTRYAARSRQAARSPVQHDDLRTAAMGQSSPASGLNMILNDRNCAVQVIFDLAFPET
jgi:hypothetical protein